MSKLDDAFLKAYAKDRGPVTRVRAKVAVDASSAEVVSRTPIHCDAQGVVRCDPGATDSAALVSQSAGGRPRGSAATESAPPPRPGDAKPSRPALRESAAAPAESASAVPVFLSFDSPQSIVGPHYQPVALDLAAFDLFGPPPAPQDAADGRAAASESFRTHSSATPADILLADTAVEADFQSAEAAEFTRDAIAEEFPAAAGQSLAPPASAEAFQAVWEVDRFDYEETIRELSEPTSLLWEVGRQLHNACSEGLKTLAVTSPLREQGRSTLAVMLSRMAAETGLRVLLLDGDLDRPSLADKLRLEVQLGWDEALRSQLPVEEVAVHSIEDGFTVLPLVAPQHPDPARPAPEQTAAMFDQLRSAFDLVIVDTGNMDIIGSWIPGAEQPGGIDAALVIEDARGDDLVAQQACLRKLKRLGIENIGIVENFAD